MYKQSPKKKVLIVITLISMISILTMLKYKRQDFIKQETSPESFFAIYINDEKVTHLPSKEEKLVFDEEKSYCNNGVSIQWSYLLWTANIDFTDYELQNKERTYCNLYFKTREEYPFDYTGNEQEFVAPKDGYYQVELWGASGAVKSSYKGGEGAYTKGIIYFKQSTNIYVYIGEEGKGKKNTIAYGLKSFNGGGGGSYTCYDYHSGTDCYNDFGGGATDIRLINGEWDDFASLKSRIMVSAGGASGTNRGDGVAGGGISGYSGPAIEGAKQTSAGNRGGFGYGGTPVYGGSLCTSNDAYGAGSGYYGGGASSANYALMGDLLKSAGSGSSFISGHKGCDAIKEESTSDNIIHMGEPNHYSGYIFNHTKMIDGMGYRWTDTKLGLEAMPNPLGGYYDLGVGHTGNGYARITYLGK